MVFKTTCADGEVTAVSYGDNGKEIGRYTLATAGQDTVLRVRPEETTVKPHGPAFIQIQYTDGKTALSAELARVRMVCICLVSI